MNADDRSGWLGTFVLVRFSDAPGCPIDDEEVVCLERFPTL